MIWNIVKIPQYKSSYMEISITKSTDKDIPFILGHYELDKPIPIDEKEIKLFKNKINDYFSD